MAIVVALGVTIVCLFRYHGDMSARDKVSMIAMLLLLIDVTNQITVSDNAVPFRGNGVNTPHEQNPGLRRWENELCRLYFSNNRFVYKEYHQIFQPWLR